MLVNSRTMVGTLVCIPIWGFLKCGLREIAYGNDEINGNGGGVFAIRMNMFLPTVGSTAFFTLPFSSSTCVVSSGSGFYSFFVGTSGSAVGGNSKADGEMEMS